MRRNTVLTLGASAGFGLLSIFMARGLISDAVDNQYRQTRSEVEIAKPVKIETVKILVADIPVERGTILMQQSIRFAEYPIESLPQGSFTDFSQLFSNPDLPPIVMYPMVEGEPVLASKLNDPGKGVGLSAMINTDKRALSIRINDVSGVAGFVMPGDTVDVLLTQETEKPGGKASSKTVVDQPTASINAIVLAQNIKVLAVDQTVVNLESQSQLAKTVTLEVHPEQAQKLTLAKAAGQLSLVLRAQDSEDTHPAQTMKVSDLVADSTVSTTVKRKRVPRVRRTPVSGTASVTVIRNNQRDEVKVIREPGSPAGGSL